VYGCARTHTFTHIKVRASSKLQRRIASNGLHRTVVDSGLEEAYLQRLYSLGPWYSLTTIPSTFSSSSCSSSRCAQEACVTGIEKVMVKPVYDAGAALRITDQQLRGEGEGDGGERERETHTHTHPCTHTRRQSSSRRRIIPTSHSTSSYKTKRYCMQQRA